MAGFCVGGSLASVDDGVYSTAGAATLSYTWWNEISSRRQDVMSSVQYVAVWLCLPRPVASRLVAMKSSSAAWRAVSRRLVCARRKCDEDGRLCMCRCRSAERVAPWNVQRSKHTREAWVCDRWGGVSRLGGWRVHETRVVLGEDGEGECCTGRGGLYMGNV